MNNLNRKIRVAIFGGAFDPITYGHIQTAKFVLDTFNEFDEVWLMPAYRHMYNKEMVSAEHRLEMCKLACTDKRIKVFDYEIKNQLTPETYNIFKTLLFDTEFKDYYFSMIIGLDNANSFHKWFKFKELEKLIRFIIIPRKGVERDLNVDWYLNEPHIFLNKETNIIEISSSRVKEILKTKPYKTISKYVDENVLDYMIKNKLYK